MAGRICWMSQKNRKKHAVQVGKLFAGFKVLAKWILHFLSQGEFSEHCHCIIAVHLLQQLGQVSYGPVRISGGDPLQHCFQGAPGRPQGVGVGDPCGWEGASGGQVGGVLHPWPLWVQQDHQLLQNIQVLQDYLQRCRLDLQTCSGPREFRCQTNTVKFSCSLHTWYTGQVPVLLSLKCRTILTQNVTEYHFSA